MDFSSLTEAQQQQLQELQQQFKEHQQRQQREAQQQQQQQQYQDFANSQQQQQVYDPSSQVQGQSYDPSSQIVSQSYDQQSYYPYSPYQDAQQQQYAAGYYQQYSQSETTAFHPPQPENNLGNDGLGSVTLGQGQVQVQHQQNMYNPNQVVGGGDHIGAPPGLNAAAAAAVAALSQLTQFAGNMDAAERAQWYGSGPMQCAQGPMHPPPVGQAPYRGGGRRGGGPFRGGGRGNFGNRSPSAGGSGPPFRGRGRGQGRGGRHYPPHGTSSSSHPESSAAEAKPTEEGAEKPEVDNHNEDAQAKAPNQKPIRIAWCELCRVDCTSLEILEQHKNGKRHKKNLQRLGEMKSACESSCETQKQNDEKIISDPNAQVPESVKEGKGDKVTVAENTATNVGTDDNKVEIEQNNDQADKPWMKRKMRGGRGGGRGSKRMKTFGGSARQPPKPKVVIPLICDLCNVKCDTQEVFDCHVAGKKHIAKLKKFEDHQALYGPTWVQALYPPNPIAQTLYRPQVPQQAFYGAQSSYPPPEAYIPPQTQIPNPELSDAPLEFNSQNAVQAQQQSASVESETKQVSTGETYAGNGVPEPSVLNPPAVDYSVTVSNQVN